MFILFHHDNVVGGFGRWLYWHFKERGVFMGEIVRHMR